MKRFFLSLSPVGINDFYPVMPSSLDVIIISFTFYHLKSDENKQFDKILSLDSTVQQSS